MLLWAVSSPGTSPPVQAVAMPEGLVAAAAHHRLPGLVYRAVRGLTGVPADLVGGLRNQMMEVAHWQLRLEIGLGTVAEALDATGCPWLMVKGPVLTASYYDEGADRAYSDLDVVVPSPDLPKAIAALESAGCHLLDRNFTRLRSLTSGEVHFGLPHGGILDLHWHLTHRAEERAIRNISMRGIFERRRSAVAFGRSVDTLDSVDTLLHLAVHACASGGRHLVWLVDLLRLIERDPPNWATVVRRAGEWRARLPVALMLDRARQVLGAPVSDDVIHALAPRSTFRAMTSASQRAWPLVESMGEPSLDRLLVQSVRVDAASSLRNAIRRFRGRGRADDAVGLDRGDRRDYLAWVEQAQREWA